MSALILLLSIAAAFVGVFALVALTIRKRAQDIHLLMAHGVEGQARVIRKLYRIHTRREGFYGIIYEFHAPDGRVYRKNVHLPGADDHKYTEGGSVPVSYMPGRPRVNALASLVDAVTPVRRGRSDRDS